MSAGRTSSVKAAAAIARTVWRPERPDRIARALMAMAPWGMTVAGGFAASAARYPKATAVIDDDGPSSAWDLWMASDSVARELERPRHRPPIDGRRPRPQPPRVRHCPARRRQGGRRHGVPQHLVRRAAARRRRRPRGRRPASSTTTSSPRSSPSAETSPPSTGAPSPPSAAAGRSCPSCRRDGSAARSC